MIAEKRLSDYIDYLENLNNDEFILIFKEECFKHCNVKNVRDVQLGLNDRRRISFDLISDYNKTLFKSVPIKLHNPSFGELRGHCPKCDSLLSSSDKFCHGCGVELYWKDIDKIKPEVKGFESGKFPEPPRTNNSRFYCPNCNKWV